jgi:SagB-type dehydrogenase family enzyme
MTEKAKSKESREISRREFLKDAGLLAGGAAIGSTVLLVACAGAAETVTATKIITQTTTHMVSWSPGDETVPTGTQLGEGGELPEPRTDGDVSIEKTLLTRRSIRTYSGEALTLGELSQLLWAAQGITGTEYSFRTAPSAGALYPLETYLVVGDVENLTPGAYQYIPEHHQLIKVIDGDIRKELTVAALGQEWIQEGAVNIIFTSIYERTTQKYGERGIRYVHMEVGHAAQNVYLQAVALDLGAVVIGAFYDDHVKEILNLSGNEQPLYIMPVGRK